MLSVELSEELSTFHAHAAKKMRTETDMHMLRPARRGLVRVPGTLPESQIRLRSDDQLVPADDDSRRFVQRKVEVQAVPVDRRERYLCPRRLRHLPAQVVPHRQRRDCRDAELMPAGMSVARPKLGFGCKVGEQPV